MMYSYKKQTGFTIVELLIVIVVIGILAAITIVAYSGIQNRANDAAVQSDLRNIGTKILEYKIVNNALPTSSSDFMPMNMKVARGSYGAHYIPTASDGYNMMYCYGGAAADRFIIVAASKSGVVYVFRDGSVSEGVGPLETYTSTCANNGLSTTGTWFFSNGNWQAWLG